MVDDIKLYEVKLTRDQVRLVFECIETQWRDYENLEIAWLFNARNKLRNLLYKINEEIAHEEIQSHSRGKFESQ